MIKQVKHLVAVERRKRSWRRTQAAVRSCCGRTEPNAADSEDDELEMRSNNSLVNEDEEADSGEEKEAGRPCRCCRSCCCSCCCCFVFVEEDDVDEEIEARRV